MNPRSYLFVPGHKSAEMFPKALACGVDEVILDLEDAVPEDCREQARVQVLEALERTPAWVRINSAGTADAERDLAAVGKAAKGVRIPKVESPDDVAWVVERLSAERPIIAAIESAAGLLEAAAIARMPGVCRLAMGGIDLRADLGCGENPEALLYARSLLVVASRGAGLPGPIDSVFARVKDDSGLAAECTWARSLGFSAKSAIHPRQVQIIHGVFQPSEADVLWATAVMEALARSDGAPTTLDSGEFIDPPVEARARQILSSRA